jgi:hypothetical protein
MEREGIKMYWAKEEYIKSRTQYYRTECKHKLSLRLAKECAESDWELYVEKFGEKEVKQNES